MYKNHKPAIFKNLEHICIWFFQAYFKLLEPCKFKWSQTDEIPGRGGHDNKTAKPVKITSNKRLVIALWP